MRLKNLNEKNIKKLKNGDGFSYNGKKIYVRQVRNEDRTTYWTMNVDGEDAFFGKKSDLRSTLRRMLPQATLDSNIEKVARQEPKTPLVDLSNPELRPLLKEASLIVALDLHRRGKTAEANAQILNLVAIVEAEAEAVLA